MQNNLSMSS